jgi:hypothetical protein
MRPRRLLDELVRDLRERRLLPIVIVLAAALVAVPILLSDSSTPPPPGVSSEPLDVPEAQVAVLAEAPYLRDYRKRLDSFKERNPFKQQFLFPTESGEESSETIAGPAPESDSVASSTTSSSSGGGSGRSSGTGSATAEVDAEVEIQIEEKLVSFKLDVLAGPVGSTRTIKGVELLDFLPTTKKPIVEFIGADVNARKAVFAVAAEVSATRGDGRCLPDEDGCQFLVLRINEAQRLDYEIDGRTYRIKVLDITRVAVDSDVVIETKTSKGSKRG